MLTATSNGQVFDDYNYALQEALISLQKAFEEAFEACFEG